MSGIVNKILDLDLFSPLLLTDKKVKELIKEQERTRKELNERLEKIAEATLNNESQLFLTVAKRNPDCAIEILKECDAK